MMEKRMLKKVSTVTAAGIMMTAMLGMQVSAAESSDSETAVKKTPTITKQITKESNIYAPKTTFKFTVAPGTAVPAGENQEAIYAGPAKGVTLDKDVIASVPADSDIGNEKITVGTTKLNVNESVFTTGKNAKPGIFRYVVSEAAADKDGNAYEGVAYTTEQKYFDVYVTSDDDGNLEVSSYIIPAVIPDKTAFSSLSFSLLILGPVANIDFNNANINCNEYVNVNTFTKFLSTNSPRQSQDIIGINEIIAELLAIRNNRFICFLLFSVFILVLSNFTIFYFCTNNNSFFTYSVKICINCSTSSTMCNK